MTVRKHPPEVRFSTILLTDIPIIRNLLWMNKIAFIGGTLFLESIVFSDWEQYSIENNYGSVTIRTDGNHFFLQRHGDPPVPPHRINHKANIDALVSLGVTGIISINSTGSLKEQISPGRLVVPDDFISFWDIPTFFEQSMCFTVPGFDDGLRQIIQAACKAVGVDLYNEGIYVQTRGPRFETKAEITVLKNYGDLVGMTVGSEATLAMERGIPYAALCSVDNYCHGIIKRPLTMDEIMVNIQSNRSKIESILTVLMKMDS